LRRRCTTCGRLAYHDRLSNRRIPKFGSSSKFWKSHGRDKVQSNRTLSEFGSASKFRQSHRFAPGGGWRASTDNQWTLLQIGDYSNLQQSHGFAPGGGWGTATDYQWTFTGNGRPSKFHKSHGRDKVNEETGLCSDLEAFPNLNKVTVLHQERPQWAARCQHTAATPKTAVRGAVRFWRAFWPQCPHL
jgi:hypothetical protein